MQYQKKYFLILKILLGKIEIKKIINVGMFITPENIFWYFLNSIIFRIFFSRRESRPLNENNPDFDPCILIHLNFSSIA